MESNHSANVSSRATPVMFPLGSSTEQNPDEESFPSTVSAVADYFDDCSNSPLNNQALQCWEHGCNGRQFSTQSNLKRHKREKAGKTLKWYCFQCGADFTRLSARNTHVAKKSCTRIRRYSNGRERPNGPLHPI